MIASSLRRSSRMSWPKRFSAVVDGVSFMHTTIFTVILLQRLV